MIASVCVFCGSRSGTNPRALRPRRMRSAPGSRHPGRRLVYGAGDVGLMGRVARAAQAAGGETFGVIPTHLLDREVGKTDLSRLVITETMHERKKVMVMNADAIVLLPGGAGSLDEFWEVSDLGPAGAAYAKPIFIVNYRWLLGQAHGSARSRDCIRALPMTACGTWSHCVPDVTTHSSRICSSGFRCHGGNALLAQGRDLSPCTHLAHLHLAGTADR